MKAEYTGSQLYHRGLLFSRDTSGSPYRRDGVETWGYTHTHSHDLEGAICRLWLRGCAEQEN